MTHLAMWSGPRNVSTAMMRAWGNRADTFVVDEPLYAFYLKATGKDHPGAAEIIRHGQTDWRHVIRELTTAMPPDKCIYFQKQMTHHLLPEIDRGWLLDLTNCFLIRNPRDVILSYIRVKAEPVLEDLGFVQQLEIFEFIRKRIDSVPAVVDAKDLLENPERLLRLLCRRVGVEFDPAMLQWQPGPRDTDGIWGRYWYSGVNRSTSFQPYKPANGNVPDRLRDIYEHCRVCYERMYQYRLI